MADDVFLSRVTHDLRGELATMVAGIHYLIRYESGLGDSGKQMLDRVNGAGQRLRRLLDELELCAWIDGAPPSAALQLEPCRLDTAVHAAVGRLERAIAQRRATVEVDVAEDLPEIEVDPEIFGAALEHAIDFAVARSPDKTARVTSAIVEGAPVLCITDEGGALDEAALARVFQPFAEKELVPRPEPGARRRERLGLGLAIARGIAAAHGGSLTAASTERGVTFTLALRGPGCRPPASV
ncbi:PAS sensor protein [Minicystis rosea]|nr:PAS sensor protein [Minicystis rosea]